MSGGEEMSLEEIKKALSILVEPGSVRELRILNTQYEGTVSGYFSDMDKLAEEALKYSGKVPAVYITLNPVIPDLLARANNRVLKKVRRTSNDDDIVKRCWLPIDLDVERPANISTTDVEHNVAHETAKELRESLAQMGWSEPVYADSGNGAHLLYRVDLPNTQESMELIKNCLSAMACLINGDKKVHIDGTVFNAARIWKLYGTMACKGENIPERPHRLSKILSIPDDIKNISKEQLIEFSKIAPVQEELESQANGSGKFDIEGWMQKFKLSVKNTITESNRVIYVLDECPFNPEHKDAHIVQISDNRLGFRCFHNSCKDFHWMQLRDKFEPDRHKLQKGTAQKKDAAVQTSFLILPDGNIAEEVYDSSGVKFALWDGSNVKYVEDIKNDRTYRPLVNDAITTSAVKLPTCAQDYGTPQELIDAIQNHIHKYLDVSKDMEVFATWYVLLSWVYDRVNTLPYLRALGDTGCGKSRFLDAIGGLCYKACMVSGAITPAPIYRMIKQWGGSIILDEADFRDSSEKNEVITILNCGFEKNRPVIRCDQNNVDNLQFLPTYCPKVPIVLKYDT
jgi:hypothetical protein